MINGRFGKGFSWVHVSNALRRCTWKMNGTYYFDIWQSSFLIVWKKLTSVAIPIGDWFWSRKGQDIEVFNLSGSVLWYLFALTWFSSESFLLNNNKKGSGVLFQKTNDLEIEWWISFQPVQPGSKRGPKAHKVGWLEEEVRTLTSLYLGLSFANWSTLSWPGLREWGKS